MKVTVEVASERRNDGFGPANVLAGGGEMGARMRALDWSATPLGPVEAWPQALKTCVRILLTSRQPMWLGWGPRLTYLYNDAYLPIIGGKHPWALARPAADVWQEIWEDVGPRLEATLGGEEGTYDEALLLIMQRNGYPEETYYTFSYCPIPDEHGGVGGILCANTDDTQRIIGERQIALLRDLAAESAQARTVAEAYTLSAHGLASDPHDVPFALLYRLEPGHARATLAGVTHIQPGHPAAAMSVPLDASAAWPFADVLASRTPQLVSSLSARFGALPSGAWALPPDKAVVLPIVVAGQARPCGMLVVGLNPYRLYDANYERFLSLATGEVAAAVAHSQTYEEERRRAEALAELDRAKTVFFSNVSHEFRTPLTLMLGPLEDTLAGVHGELNAFQQDELQVVHRNSLRLLRLVNTLLDFSRIEAGRIQAAYEPTDLPMLTADLASTFRSAVERAGLRLVVDTPPLPSGVQMYVDHEMWEKVVLNLLSNAFKHTFEGEIAVSLRAAANGATVQLVVRDTGTGIPADELPRLFERFHRVQGARSRTHEGTGIGLALVHELVKLHGGSIAATSDVGVGTTFTVTLPSGSSHLPADRIVSAGALNRAGAGAAAFLEEASRWLPGVIDDTKPNAESAVPRTRGPEPPGRPRVLLADDNADMREYLRRLLAKRYVVQAVADGAQALQAAQQDLPDLVLSDVMMPGLDGHALVQALRADPRTQDVPVILLSARAGEEAQVEGLESGADDYLVKPFAAREMLARVDGRIELARLRREKSEAEARARLDMERLAAEREVLLIGEHKAREEAEAAVRARDEFLSIASHELRTPLTTLKGVAQLLERNLARGTLDAARDERHLRTVSLTTDRLARLVEDLLDVSRLRTGQLQLRARTFELVALVRDAVAQAAARPDATGHRLLVEAHCDDCQLDADPDRIEQVVVNLLDNAVKYNPYGGDVTVSLKLEPRAGRSGVLLCVRDTGIGLPPNQAETIFQPFGRASNAAARNIPGMGLGLYICRQIAEAHGGRLWAESPGVGQGTVFSFWLPTPA